VGASMPPLRLPTCCLHAGCSARWRWWDIVVACSPSPRAGGRRRSSGSRGCCKARHAGAGRPATWAEAGGEGARARQRHGMAGHH
jgi:hypothetical protein